MMFARFSLLTICLLGLILPTVSQADTKLHALVIGNGAYQNEAHRLKNPTNDAKLMERTLRELGFKVTLELDSSHRSMRSALVKFARSVPKGGLAFYYFAGHGISVDGENYLIPTDAELSERELVEYDTTPQSMILKVLEGSGSNLNVVVLDCCLNNPFQRSWRLSRSRGYSSRTLAVPQAMPEGTVIAYATDTGKTADDGVGQNNSPYTEELAVALSKRPQNGLMLDDVFLDVREAVLKRTKQAPWYSYKAGRYMLWRPDRIQTAKATPAKPSTTQLTNVTRPKARLRLEMRDKDDKPSDNSLLWQGDTYANEGDYDLAIETYTAILSNSNGSEDRELRKQARIARGSVYMQRAIKSNKIKDFQFALIDYKSMGRQGIRLAVRADSADLKIKKAITGKVSKYQTALVTQARKGWFWVESVNGNEKLQGWVSSDAFSDAAVKKTPASKPKAKADRVIVKSPSTTYNSPSTSYTPSSTNYNPQVRRETPQPVTRGGAYTQPQATYGGGQTVYGNRNYNQGNYNNGQYNGQSNGYSNQRQYSNSNGSQWNNRGSSNTGQQWNNRTNNTSGATPWTQRYMKKNGRAPSIWETPKWESPAEIRRGRANGTLR